MNFFFITTGVEPDAYANLYAERLDNAALICFHINDFETFRKLTREAAEFRGIFKEKSTITPRKFLEQKTIIYNVDASFFGLPKVDRKQLGAFIDKLNDIPDVDRKRIHREAMTKKSTIFDIAFEDLPYAIEEV